jgi:hypothetical protein
MYESRRLPESLPRALRIPFEHVDQPIEPGGVVAIAPRSGQFGVAPSLEHV